MERAPRARVPNRDKAQTDANPEAKIAHPKVKLAGDEAREQAKVPAAVRVEDEERDKVAGGRPNFFHVTVLSSLQHGEAA